MTERVQGPVTSPLTMLLQHFEVSMWAEGIDPEVALRVLNRITFGDPRGNPQGGSVAGIPDWAEELAAPALSRVWGAVLGRAALEAGYEQSQGDVKLVVLAMVRKVLQTEPGAFDQALSP